jgi:hypothetical protein
LSKTGDRRTRGYQAKGSGPESDEPPGDGGPDEAVRFIAETAAALAEIARRHELGMLVRLLEMVRMEADERVRGRARRSLS